jgi:hypothetical protein
MDISRINIAFFLLLTGITFLMQKCNCTKPLGLDCAKTVYNFEITVKGNPGKDTLVIGDTLWFELNSPTQLKDTKDNSIVNYSGAANLGSAVNFRALSNAKEYTIEAVNKFGYFLKEGLQLRATNDNIEYNFNEKNNRFVFLLGVLPKEKGTYRILFSNAANVYRNNDQCTKAAFVINIENSDRHPYLNSFYTGGTYPPGGDYYFVVK